MSKNPPSDTIYESPGSGTLAFERNVSVDDEIVACVALIKQLRQDYQEESQVVSGLMEVEAKLQSLRFSGAPEGEMRKRLESLLQVPIGKDKTIRLDAFRKTAARARLASESEYKAQVRKLVRNTLNNIGLLSLSAPDDPVLRRFMDELQGLNLDDYRALRVAMNAISKSPQLWKYNQKKKAFLTEWLRPFQGALDKPIEQMSEEEFQDALHKVEQLRETRLEQMTNLEMDRNRDPFRVHNRTMNPLMNGRDEEFWGGAEARDEFVHLVNLLIIRFSFNLEDRFLLFRTKDSGFCYLVGFADEAFDQVVDRKDGRVGLYPHLKVFVKAGERFAEITRESYSRNAKTYYGTLRTAVVPFLTSVAVMVERELSENIKSAFDMWT